MTNRIATYPATNRIIMENMRLQAQLADTQVQMSTGLKSVTYKGIASDAQRLLSIERNVTNLKNYNASAVTVGNNINIAYNSVKSILDLTNNYLSTLTQALGGASLDPQVVKNQGDILIQEVVGLLNVQSGGRYLFAGSNIDTPPVDITDPGWTAQTTPSTPNTSYYQGDAYVQSGQLSESLTINYGFNADHPGFEKLLRGLNLAINNPGNKAALGESLDLLRESVGDMGNVYSQMSTFARTVENQNQRNEEDMATLNNIVGNIKGIDIAETTVRQTEIETQIQASYASSVKILNLRLIDYI